MGFLSVIYGGGGWEYASLICISTHRRGWRRCAEGSGVRRGVMTAFRWPLHAGALAFVAAGRERGSERGPTAAGRSGRGESEDVYMRMIVCLMRCVCRAWSVEPSPATREPRLAAERRGLTSFFFHGISILPLPFTGPLSLSSDTRVAHSLHHRKKTQKHGSHTHTLDQKRG